MAQPFSVARPEKPKVYPAFFVQKLPGKRTKQVITFGAKGEKTVKEVEVDAGYLVTMRAGHSIRVETEADLIRLGFDQTIPVVNDEGEAVYEMPNNIDLAVADA